MQTLFWGKGDVSSVLQNCTQVLAFPSRRVMEWSIFSGRGTLANWAETAPGASGNDMSCSRTFGWSGPGDKWCVLSRSCILIDRPLSDPADEDDHGPTNTTAAEDALEGDMWGDPDIPINAEGEFDDEDDDDILEAPTGGKPNMLPQPDRFDTDGNPFITVVDVSGIHHLPVVFCSCDTTDSQIDIAYLRMGLFPASFERIKTLFTFDVLQDFRASNLECKTSAYQYYQKLRRLTCPAFPTAVLNRYRELRRVSRQYRNMKLWKMHGRAHDEPEGPEGMVAAARRTDLAGQVDLDGEPMVFDEEFTRAFTQQEPDAVPRGKLASFCPACPQPGVNLCDNWEDDDQQYAAVESASN